MATKDIKPAQPSLTPNVLVQNPPGDFHGFHGGRIQSDGKQQSVLGSVTSSFVKDVHSTLIEPAISFSPLCNIYICGNQVPLKLKFKS